MLVALDSSVTADRVLELALQLSRQYDSELLLCTVVEDVGAVAEYARLGKINSGVEMIPSKKVEAAAAVLEEASSRARLAGIRPSSVLLEGKAVGAIVAYANERNVNAIVMGTEGKEPIDRQFHGSTAQGVLRMTDAPTFVVNHLACAVPAFVPSIPINRILIALDDSDPSDAAVAFAFGLAAAKDSVLFCCSAIDTGQLADNVRIYGSDPSSFVEEVRKSAFELIEAKTDVAARAGRPVEHIVLEGDAADAILDVATKKQADLIVCGTHGRRGLRRFLLGSVAESIVRRSATPVLVVRRSVSC